MITPRTRQTTAAVAAHYDALDAFYRDIWGEHVHHGFWATGRETPAQAVIALITLIGARLNLSPGMILADIGCGYGATAQYFAEHHATDVTGYTVSAAQAKLASARNSASGSLFFHLRDWLSNTACDETFDGAYAIESSEHMPDKQRFFDEAFRTLKPGGRLVIAAWLATDHPAWQIRHLLEPICREGRLPGMGNETDYRNFAENAGFKTISAEDISSQVSRTWSLCATRFIRRAVTQPRYIKTLLDRNEPNRIFAATVFRLILAYRTNAMRYVILTYRKP